MLKRNTPHNGEPDSEAHFDDEKFMRAIEKDMLRNIHSHIRGRRYFVKRAFAGLSVAASILLLVAAGYYFFGNRPKSESLLTVNAPKGRISIITLPDGSKVWLNAGSTLSYPTKFASVRRVELNNGEAFFDVKHDKNHPFIVSYGGLHTQVLGTSFNIKYYKKLNDVRVTVVSGLVAVGDKSKNYGLIKPDKELIYDRQHQTYSTRNINAQNVAGWRERRVNLYDVPFDDLILMIENIYNVNISYDHSRTTHVVSTIHFSSTDDVKQVLEVIKTIYRLNYTINGKEVKLEAAHL